MASLTTAIPMRRLRRACSGRARALRPGDGRSARGLQRREAAPRLAKPGWPVRNGRSTRKATVIRIAPRWKRACSPPTALPMCRIWPKATCCWRRTTPSHEGGFAAAVARLGGDAPPLYHLDTTQPDAPRSRTLPEEIARVRSGARRQSGLGQRHDAPWLSRRGRTHHDARQPRRFRAPDPRRAPPSVRPLLRRDVGPISIWWISWRAKTRRRWRRCGRGSTRCVEAGLWSTRRNSIAMQLGGRAWLSRSSRAGVPARCGRCSPATAGSSRAAAGRTADATAGARDRAAGARPRQRRDRSVLARQHSSARRHRTELRPADRGPRRTRG